MAKKAVLVTLFFCKLLLNTKERSIENEEVERQVAFTECNKYMAGNSDVASRYSARNFLPLRNFDSRNKLVTLAVAALENSSTTFRTQETHNGPVQCSS